MSAKIYASQDWVEKKITQPDWSQNDSNSAGYIKNRTHYKATKQNILFEDDIGLTPVMDDGIYYFNPELELQDDVTYIISTDNETVSGVCADGKISLGDCFDGYAVRITNYSLGITYPGTMSFHLKICTEISTFKALDEEYIPSTVPKIATAQVGQLLSVKAVDENGKPTEWEVVDPFVLTDESTGTKYKLSVSDGKLVMNEVASG